jgi:hypothetical protein
MRRRIVPLLTASLLAYLTAAAAAEVYEVGPTQALVAIGEVPWESLEPGDEVRIHWRAEPYREKWVMAVHGTAAAPIVVRGIKGPGGERPVIDGRDATTRSSLDFWAENRGVIKIGGANQPSSSYGSHLVIEGLDIRNGAEPYTFTGRNGLTAYNDNAAAIYLEHARHVTIRDCVLRDSGNGLFAASGSADILVEGSHIHGNGVVGSIYEHNNYTSADGIVFQFNRFGPLRPGAPGNNLKDRSVGTIVRYNWIEGGNRQLDLVEGHGGNQGDVYVYGNVLIEPDGAGNRQVIHYGGDGGNAGSYRKGTLYFFHNTVISHREGRTTLVRLSSPAQRADLRNNILYASAGGDQLAIVDRDGDVAMAGNWLRPGWVEAHGSATGSIAEAGSQIAGELPGFVDDAGFDFHLRDDSPCRDAAGPLAAGLPAEHAVIAEFGQMPGGSPRAVDGAADVGAFEFADAVPPDPDDDDPPGDGDDPFDDLDDPPSGYDHGGPVSGHGDAEPQAGGCSAGGGSGALAALAALLLLLACRRFRAVRW